ncbi:DUF6338 family protein [Schumannella luteola]|uniref:DUF6338 family protein n=1 Tax=Schumannella luteola TaxID=472059 RepID=UPI0031B5B28B
MLEAVVASAIFDSVYALVLHDQVAVALGDVRGYVAQNVSATMVVFLVGGVGVPFVVAWLVYGQIPVLDRPSQLWREIVRPKLSHSQQVSDAPTAWDYGNKTVVGGWVRVRIAEGVWVGGVFGDDARFSTYPEARDLFISTPWNLGPAGEFQSPVAGSQGVWLAIKDDYVVEWLYDQEDSDDELRESIE